MNHLREYGRLTATDEDRHGIHAPDLARVRQGRCPRRPCRVALLQNERDEWELPGGRLEPSDSSPEAAVEREIAEETGWDVKAGPLLDVWIYQPLPDTMPERRVVIVTYGCTVLTPNRRPIVSTEHSRLALFTADRVPELPMPDGYKQSIAAWSQRR